MATKFRNIFFTETSAGHMQQALIIEIYNL